MTAVHATAEDLDRVSRGAAAEIPESSVKTLARRAPAALQQTGVFALATMSDEEFAYRLETMVKGRERVQQIQRAMMTEGVHYGRVPGQPADAKPGLFKPGAEVLCLLYNYVPDSHIDEIVYGDPANDLTPALRVRVRCEIRAGDLSGPVVGVGFGAANSWEVKYRYRNAARVCPSCTKPTLIKSKFPSRSKEIQAAGNPWWCNAKAGGCGTEFKADDPRILEQVVGRVANPDALDLENTLVKMAEKRAKVDATIAATGTSDLFTQDVEDMRVEGEEPTNGKAAAAAAADDPRRIPGDTKHFGGHGGKLITDGSIKDEDLTLIRKTMYRQDAKRYAGQLQAIDEELEARRHAAADGAGQ